MRDKLRTAWALGARNIMRVLLYRLSLRWGLNAAQRAPKQAPQSPFFVARRRGPAPAPVWNAWPENARLFGWFPFNAGEQPPDWAQNPFTGQSFPAPERPWWRIEDFDPAVGDIKQLWELSRWDWVLAFAQQARAGNEGAQNRINAWLSSWLAANPPITGPNWKCGQEAAIRVIRLVLASVITGDEQRPAAGLLDLIELHLRRISPTVAYAIAQDNNHGTSEAAALFVGGNFLQRAGRSTGRRWERAGRRLLENRVCRLVGAQGTFSQYSVNYHRLMLDTLSVAEWWRQRQALAPFSAKLLVRASAATHWLYAMTSEENGDAPNIGANDGALLLPLAEVDYRDHRPSIQLAMALFVGKRAYPKEASCNALLRWLEVDVPVRPAKPVESLLAADGGFACFRCGDALAVVRFPRFRFRPGHADALHLDLWAGGLNLLRDAGTYSYNSTEGDTPDLAATASHNTIEFDRRDQMPRLTRFLFGGWLADASVTPIEALPGGIHFSAEYTDRHGARHRREVSLTSTSARICDVVAGFDQSAVLRWRLRPGKWVITQTTSRGIIIRDTSAPDFELAVNLSVTPVRTELVSGWESRYYLEKSPVSVLEVEVDTACEMNTRVQWQ